MTPEEGTLFRISSAPSKHSLDIMSRPLQPLTGQPSVGFPEQTVGTQGPHGADLGPQVPERAARSRRPTGVGLGGGARSGQRPSRTEGGIRGGLEGWEKTTWLETAPWRDWPVLSQGDDPPVIPTCCSSQRRTATCLFVRPGKDRSQSQNHRPPRGVVFVELLDLQRPIALAGTSRFHYHLKPCWLEGGGDTCRTVIPPRHDPSNTPPPLWGSSLVLRPSDPSPLRGGPGEMAPGWVGRGRPLQAPLQRAKYQQL